MRGKIVSENAYALVLSIVEKIDRETALKKCGVEIPFTQKGSTTKPCLISKDEKNIIYDYYYKDNMSLKDVGKIYNVSAVTVKNFLTRVGIPIKPRGVHCK